MKLLVISDFHGAGERLEPIKDRARESGVEAVIFCGDIVKGHARGDEWLAARREGRPPRRDLTSISKEAGEDLTLYDTFYSSMNELSVATYVVPGNMDAPFARYARVAEEAPAKYPRVRFAHQRLLPLSEEFMLLGVGGELSEREREDFFVLVFPEWEARYAAIAGREISRSLILLTHTPPVGAQVDLDAGGHKGSLVVNRLIDMLAPAYLFCGHAHKAQAQEQLAGTVIVNPGALKDGRYALVDTSRERVELKTL